jgi:hypothetical protein
MVLEIVHLIILTATLACGLLVVWYAHRIHGAQVRELSFLDARDLDHRRRRAEARHVKQAWNKEVHNWHRDTRAILGKLYAIAAESSVEERDTRLIPPPPPPLPPPPARSEARTPGTLLSIPSPVAPSGRRPVATVETKSICHACDGGFIGVGNGGIGRCRECAGSGFIHAR